MDDKETQVKSSGFRLSQNQLLGVVVIVVLIALGLVFRSNGEPSEQTEPSIPTPTTVQTTSVPKSLLQTAEDAIALNPLDSEAWYAKGVYLQRNIGDSQSAVESYSRAIEINPKFLSALFNRAFAYKDLGALDEAIADFETVVDLQNGVAPQALLNLGLIATDQGDIALGDEYFKKAYEQDPSLRP